MKLEDAFSIKSLRQMKHVGMFGDDCLSVSVEGSNDLRKWFRVTSLKGAGWKYFRFAYRFSGLLAVDRFAGTILDVERRASARLK